MSQRNKSNFKRRSVAERKAAPRTAPGMVRLFVNVGRAQRIMVKDIISTIAIEADIPARSIGQISIYDKFTFVEVPEEYAEQVITALHRNYIKGYKINVEPAKLKR